ncbi:hypothetical protein [Streptomyces sp. NBC_00872]|uniref:hypothetical protein n=1 Tax=Streptomyces sp. NBC_00872 TaxID=2903686 RepID=UPI00386A88E0
MPLPICAVHTATGPKQARRCAEKCGLARESAKLAAEMVARVYGEDMAAKEDAGLKFASAAAHHD